MCRIVKNTAAVLMLLFAGIATAGQGIWQDATPAQLQAKSLNSKKHQYSADHVALRNTLSLAPHESSGNLSQQIELPMPDGSLQRFTIVESPIMESAIAARYPEFKSFKIYGIDDPMASGRADITPQGFHAMLRTSGGRLFIDPGDASGLYQSRFRSGQPDQKFSCGVHRMGSKLVDQPKFLQKSANRLPGNLLEFRLAVAATEEYVAAVGGMVADAQSAIFTAINRVNDIYQSDLGIKLILVWNDGRLIDNGPNVSFSNTDTFALLRENQAWIDSVIGAAAYDIGHVFSTGGGGAAFLGSACDDPIKAKGTSGQSFQLDQDSFYIDYVAHEIGHQFNAEHSFNGTTSSCDSGRNSASAFEPGSGSTIMAYAGICGPENLQLNSDATFHAASIAEIDGFTRSAGSCYAIPTTPTNNNDPTIAPIANRVIPANTPFILDGIAADIDPMPALTYQWDQMDAGCPTDFASFGTDNGSNALFRSYLPRDETWRNFPALGTQVRGRFDKAEVLPCHNRDLDFRLTARDGRSGQDIEDVRISVDNSTGPFKITSLNPPPPTPIIAGIPFAVNWDAANTHLPPVNCTNVDFDLISFSVDYSRYSIHPLDTDPMDPTSNLNDGGEFVTLNPTILNPETAEHLQSRVRVKCSDNIFYDISDADLTVEATMFPAVSLDDDDFAAYSFVTPAIAMATIAPVCGPVVVCSTPPPAVKSGGKSGSSGAVDYLWLLMMTGIIALVKLYRRYGLQ